MWEISNKLQILGFLYAIILGMMFCIFYDFLRAIRIAKSPKNFTVFLQDTFYFTIISLFTFIFLLAITNGEIRAYILLGILLGFIMFNIGISPFTLKILIWFLKKLFSILNIVNKFFYKLFDKAELYLTYFLKKVLKIVRDLLYTIKKWV